MMNPDDIDQRVRRFQQKIGAVVKDEYYADTNARIDTVLGEISNNWRRIVKVKREYDALADAVPVGQGFLTFYDYVREYYGIKMQMNGDDLSPEYAIVDEKKYTVFLLKFNNGN
jgi:hypothetical protein